DSCKVDVCHNGGTCVTTAEKDSFICICSDGFKGDTCNETEPGPCHPNPCKNDGICELQRGDVFGGYTCKCMKGFEGTHCENSKNPFPA
ncbi:milk fat globule EGF and factor V/VIII domain containing b, partial [Tachysurus ichikawai]